MDRLGILICCSSRLSGQVGELPCDWVDVIFDFDYRHFEEVQRGRIVELSL
jgi:hypothetical protein